ncbi:MAG: hypothetical protein DRO36_06505 [Candidatus Hecatellales archaeon]|nr:MAG: hypothetical protein DRO36_06505 [Candidatus Hecatellales archaeon]
MVYVQGGMFEMGSDGLRYSEYPIHEVTVGSFYIGRYEVTVREFKEFVEETGYKTTAEKRGGAKLLFDKKWVKIPVVNWRKPYVNPYFRHKETHPVVCVSWYDAIHFCNWLSKKHGLRECYTIKGEKVSCDFGANGYRLPTEAEWEYAARGGKKSKGYIYAGSNDCYEVAWWEFNAQGRPHRVGTKAPNELGIYDMSGNVAEWCWDYWNRYTGESLVNPKGPESGESRVVRGGSWYSRYPTITRRGCEDPLEVDTMTGFRIARSAVELK